jgi:hypothetical protein
MWTMLLPPVLLPPLPFDCAIATATAVATPPRSLAQHHDHGTTSIMVTGTTTTVKGTND